MQVSIDFETRSKVDLIKQGLFNYAMGESTKILCCAVSEVGDHPTHIFIADEFKDLYLEAVVLNGNAELPTISEDEFVKIVTQAETVFAYNASFEIEIWNHIGVKQRGWPEIPNERWKCKQAMGLYAALPGYLDGITEALELSEKKDKKGKALIRKLCCPRKPTKKDPSIWCNDPILFYELFDYCVQDVVAEKGI